MQRYSIPFKDFKNNSYEVKIYIDGYVGAVTELTGARNTFVVTGNDSDFVYEPLRTSTATLTIIDSNLLLDLFSINNQYAPVKLYKGNKLMWTGYIIPEQFTQPYKPTLDSISIDCVSAMGTLENIKYEQQTDTGFITAMDLLRYLVKSANGGYEKVYIPHVYASSSANYAAKRNIFDEIELSEENFISEEMMLDEVLEYFCRFFAWAMYDQEGSLYFVDPDWHGEYYAYNEGLTSYVLVTPNEILLQDIGFAGSDHTIDVLPGYNKVTIKAINNVFDELTENEEYDILDEVGRDYHKNDKKYDYKRFLKEKLWKVYHYDKYRTEIEEIEGVSNINDNVCGAVLMKEALFDGKEMNGTIVPDVADYPWADCVQMRSVTADDTIVFGGDEDGKYPVLTYRGKNAIWKDGAIGIKYEVMVRPSQNMRFLGDKIDQLKVEVNLACCMRIGKWYWNGGNWQLTKTNFKILSKYEGNSFSGWTSVEDTKTPDMPYTGLSGYIIELPSDNPIIGELEFTAYCLPGWVKNVGPFTFSLYGYVLKGLALSYKKKDSVTDEGEDGDRIYENVVNEKYMSELDEIEFGISSYNADGATYSKALMNGNFLTDNLYSVIEDKLVRPEEALIRRIVNRYQVTKIKLTQVIKNSDEIHPFTILSDNSMKIKKFMMLGGVWDYEDNSIQLAMTENGAGG
jgi:hypothetical protein|nr:MAG TPA: hypothetical protein [Caudoviricetes sp.]